MKYLKIIIASLVLLLIALGGYYLYLRLKPVPVVTPPADNQGSASGQLYQFLPQNQQYVDTGDQVANNNFFDYTTFDLTDSSDSIVVNGKLKSIESVGRGDLHEGIAYNYLINIIRSDGALLRVWLTRPEYQSMTNSTNPGDLVTLTLTQDAITLKKQ